MAYTQPGEL